MDSDIKTSFTIPRITQNQRIQVSTFNRPIQKIQQALNILSQRISGISQKSSILQYEVTLDHSVKEGDLVFADFQASNACFSKAFLSIDQKGNLQASSYVHGLVISKSSQGNILLRAGYYQSGVISNILPTNASTGFYYLSSDSLLKATPSVENQYPVIYYYGDQKFSLCTQLNSPIPKVGIQSIQSNTLNILQLQNSGTVSINQKQISDSVYELNRFALISKQGSRAVYTPVVSKLSSQHGLLITDVTNSNSQFIGHYNIDLLTAVNSIIPATQIRLNGAQRVSDNLGILTYTFFPRGTTTSIVTTTYTKVLNTNKLAIWGTFKTAAQLQTQIYIFKLDTGISNNIAFTQPQAVVNLKCPSPQLNSLVYVEQELSLPQLQTNNYIVITRLVSKGNLDIYLHQTGIKVL